MRRLWDYLDGELDDARMAEVDAHLATCRGCPSHFEFAAVFLDAVAAARREHQRPEALRAEGFGGVSGP